MLYRISFIHYSRFLEVRLSRTRGIYMEPNLRDVFNLSLPYASKIVSGISSFQSDQKTDTFECRCVYVHFLHRTAFSLIHSCLWMGISHLKDIPKNVQAIRGGSAALQHSERFIFN